MDWTKIKIKHFVSSPLSMADRGRLITLIALTAMLEREPTEKEIRQFVGKTAAKWMQNGHKTNAFCPSFVIKKVLEDVQKIQHKRELSRTTSDTYRKTQKDSDVSRDVSNDATDKIREDKRRKEKKKNKEKEAWFLVIWNQYPAGSRKGKDVALKRFLDSVKNEDDFQDMQVALDNYLSSSVVKKVYIQRGSRWFQEWTDWIHHEEFETEEDKIQKRKEKMEKITTGVGYEG